MNPDQLVLRHQLTLIHTVFKIQSIGGGGGGGVDHVNYTVKNYYYLYLCFF